MVSLVVPGSSERMLAKARGIEAAEVIVDLEDAVIPERKPEALALVLDALNAAEPFAARQVTVRVNAVGSPWCHRELIALATSPGVLHGVIVPKVEHPGDLAFADRLLTGAERAAAADHPAGARATGADPAGARGTGAGGARRGGPLAVQALIETAAGLAALPQITAATPRLHGLILGYADLSVSLGRSPSARDDLDRWLAVQDAVLIAARAAGIRAVDGPHLVIDDLEGLSRAAARSAALGFDGKWAIHPSQIGPITEAFAPSEGELSRARQVLDALARAAQQGGGAVALDGEMLDEPVRLAALRTLARAGTDPTATTADSTGAAAAGPPAARAAL